CPRGREKIPARLLYAITAMPRTAAFLIPIALFCPGCSCLIAQSGKDILALGSKEEVRKQFGAPVKSGEGPDPGQSYDDYRYHGKVAETWRAGLYSFNDGMTFGLGEFWLFPYELYRVGRNCLHGQDLRIYHDSAGHVVRYDLDGWRMDEMHW